MLAYEEDRRGAIPRGGEKERERDLCFNYKVVFGIKALSTEHHHVMPIVTSTPEHTHTHREREM